MDNSSIKFRQVFIACGYTDLRAGIDRLAAIINQKFKLDPFQKDVLFLFCGRRRDRFKGLVWRGTGFLLLYKRIESGYVQWPRSQEEVAELTPDEFQRLLAGYQILQQPSVHDAECTMIA